MEITPEEFNKLCSEKGLYKVKADKRSTLITLADQSYVQISYDKSPEAMVYRLYLDVDQIKSV